MNSDRGNFFFGVNLTRNPPAFDVSLLREASGETVKSDLAQSE